MVVEFFNARTKLVARASYHLCACDLIGSSESIVLGKQTSAVWSPAQAQAEIESLDRYSASTAAECGDLALFLSILHNTQFVSDALLSLTPFQELPNLRHSRLPVKYCPRPTVLLYHGTTCV